MTKIIKLPSGKNAEIKKGKGRNLLQAQINAKTSEEIIYALIAELVEIDGVQMVYEDILELDLEDVIALQAEFSGKFERKTPAQPIQESVPSQTVNQSSIYVKSQDGNIQK